MSDVADEISAEGYARSGEGAEWCIHEAVVAVVGVQGGLAFVCQRCGILYERAGLKR